ncbi:MAG: stage IV sporulation protein A, partial [Christensenellaceae bacterium]
MQTFDVYADIAKRTGGEFYIGFVGPVRTGKSTFIRQLVTKLVLPHLPPSSFKEITSDELPLSSDGKTVMTTEPKFIPGEAVTLRLDSAEVKTRFIDCVGYPVTGANGFEEEGKPRTVNTPWSDSPLPFAEAASLGTGRVIREHSTVGILVTTDGSFTGLERAEYERAEEIAVRELQEIGKPFVIVLNTTDPDRAEA